MEWQWSTDIEAIRDKLNEILDESEAFFDDVERRFAGLGRVDLWSLLPREEQWCANDLGRRTAEAMAWVTQAARESLGPLITEPDLYEFGRKLRQVDKAYQFRRDKIWRAF